MRRRFFVEKFQGNAAVIAGEAAHHLGRVLRAQAGQLYELTDGEAAWLARIDSVAQDRIHFALIEQLPAGLPRIHITLLLSIVKFDAFEWALEKATELGVSAIVPLAALRSEKSLVAAAKKRSERWKKILLESSQQSRRLRVPTLEDLRRPEDIFPLAAPGLRLFLSERPDAPPLKKILSGAPRCKTAILAIGPEGGWADDELFAARASGFLEASLGGLILRAETAVAAALSILNYEYSS
ncbi:MAG TPA: RsmE family RNA methyltransferase [Candidatus Acidoferrum sp.]|nr:RsmE family RNA methyltransferase [Candidatus Acidoferrum sp.]